MSVMQDDDAAARRRAPIEPIRLAGVVNFRDFGGYAVAGGRIRTGRLYRSGHHGDATDADVAALGAIDWALVADLRRASERGRDPARRRASFRGILIEHEGPPETSVAPHLAFLAEPDISAEIILGRMTESYRGYPFDPTYLVLYRRYFSALAEADGPVMVNCHAGKDRTGVLVALTQHVLGATRGDIVEDYLLTNRGNRAEQRLPELARNFLRDHGKPVPEALLRQVMRAEARYLEAFFAAIEQRHGTIDAYLDEVVGVTPTLRRQLQATYVEQSRAG